MMFPLDVVVGTELLAVVLSAGAATMLTALVQAWRSIREGAKSDEQDAFSDVEKSRRKAARRAVDAENERDFWHTRAGSLEWIILTKLGPDALPPLPPLPRPTVDDEDTK